MLSRIENVSKEYEGSEFYGLDIKKNPEVSGEFMTFVTPVLIIYYDGMEIMKKIRFFPLDEIRETLDRFLKKVTN